MGARGREMELSVELREVENSGSVNFHTSMTRQCSFFAQLCIACRKGPLQMHQTASAVLNPMLPAHAILVENLM